MLSNEIILVVILSYLTGSFPSAVWICKTFYNIDVREFGSGNAVAQGLTAGTIFYSNTHLYIVTDSNTIRRVALSTFRWIF